MVLALFAMFAIIIQYVTVQLDIQEMRLFLVFHPRLHLVSRFYTLPQISVLLNLFYYLPAPPARDPCYPNPCGPNARCDNGTCSCIPEYRGDPYRECRPECVLNSDCPQNRACINLKCKDPCPGTCGENAECNVFNHYPSCTCRPDYTGDPFVRCNRIECK